MMCRRCDVTACAAPALAAQPPVIHRAAAQLEVRSGLVDRAQGRTRADNARRDAPRSCDRGDTAPAAHPGKSLRSDVPADAALATHTRHRALRPAVHLAVRKAQFVGATHPSW